MDPEDKIQVVEASGFADFVEGITVTGVQADGREAFAGDLGNIAADGEEVFAGGVIVVGEVDHGPL